MPGLDGRPSDGYVCMQGGVEWRVSQGASCDALAARGASWGEWQWVGD